MLLVQIFAGTVLTNFRFNSDKRFVRGRKPKPTHLRLIAGNPGRRPINLDEPIATGDLDAAPEWMSEKQKEAWRYAIDSAPAGLLKKLDKSILAVWVVSETLHREAAEKIAKYGAVIKAPHTGVPIASPYVNVLNKQAAIMIKAASEMGFTPSSRTRVKTDGRSTAKNPFDDLNELPQ